MFARDPGQYARERVDGDPQFEAKSWNYSNRKESRMLVLSRRADESIMIGDTIELFVIEIRGDQVRLGLEAPRDMSVHRREVYDAIQKSKDQPCTPS